MSNIVDAFLSFPWYDGNIENCIETGSLMGAILWGFLYAKNAPGFMPDAPEIMKAAAEVQQG